MPRNASGTYSLPSGNPVVAGTTIEASWANTTLSDVANELTNSLSRTGAGGMLAPFRLSDGTVGAPGIAFLNETSSGLYRPSASNVSMAVSGVQAMTWSNANVVVPSGIQFNTSNCVISGLPTPTSATAAATKGYVDTALAAVTTSSTRQTYTATASQKHSPSLTTSALLTSIATESSRSMAQISRRPTAPVWCSLQGCLLVTS